MPRNHYNPTYNSRNGKRAHVNYKEIEELAVKREKEVNAELQRFEMDFKMVSERALKETVMDERGENRMFRTIRNLGALPQEFVECSRTPSTEQPKRRESLKSVKLEPISTLPEETEVSTSMSMLTEGQRKVRKRRVQKMPKQEVHPQKQPLKKAMKLPALPRLTFQCLNTMDDDVNIPLSYSDFLLDKISEVKRSNSVNSLLPIQHTKTHLSSLTDLDNGYHSSNSYHGTNGYNSHNSNRHSLDNSMLSHKRWRQLPRIEGVRERAAKVKKIMGKSTYS